MTVERRYKGTTLFQNGEEEVPGGRGMTLHRGEEEVPRGACRGMTVERRGYRGTTLQNEEGVPGWRGGGSRGV